MLISNLDQIYAAWVLRAKFELNLIFSFKFIGELLSKICELLKNRASNLRFLSNFAKP
jgi:hypothetical protein